MRRSPFAYRRGVLDSIPLQHVWISEDLLSRAFEQFFHRGCPHQKRHGSHVPGPLEARRRAVKRRMTALAFPSSEAPISPLFNFGALFALRSNPQTAWKYEPPTLPHSQRSSGYAIEHQEQTWFNHDLETPSSPQPDGSLYPFDTANMSLKISRSSKKTPERKAWLKSEQLYASTSRRTVESWVDNYNTLFGPVGTVQTLSATVLGLPQVISLLSDVHSPIPELGTPQSLEFTNWLSTIPLESRDITLPYYRRVAAQIISTEVDTQSEPYKLYLDNAGVSAVIRATWSSILETGTNQTAPLDTHQRRMLARIGRMFTHKWIRQNANKMYHRPEEAANMIADFVTNCRKNRYSAHQVTLLLRCIPPVLLRAWMRPVPRQLLEGRDRYTRLSPEHATNLQTWLTSIMYLDRISLHTTEGDDLVKLALQSLAEGGVRPAHIANHLVRIHRTYPVRFLLSWVPLLEEVREARLKEATALVETYHKVVELAHEEKHDIHATFAELLIHLHDASIPNHGVAEQMAEYLLELPGSSACATMLAILKRVQEKGAKLTDTAFLDSMFGQVLDKQDCSFAQVRTLFNTLQLGRDLLVEQRGVHHNGDDSTVPCTDQFAKIIAHTRRSHHLPPRYATMPLSNLRTTDTELIHQIAYQVSSDLTLSCRQAWRFTYMLYKYLIENERTIGPLFTRSVVRVALMRPLMEHRFVSSQRLVWVRKLVEHVEGPAVAAKVQNTFFYWRGELISLARKSHYEIGGKGKVHVNTMKRLGLI